MNDNLRTKIETYSDDATALYDVGHAQIPTATFPSVEDETDADRIKRAQGTVSAALSQLGQAAKLASDQDGREGYKAVVQMMKSTSDAATAICNRIQHIVGAPTTTSFPSITSAQYNELTALNEILRVLAQLSPAAVWHDASANASS